MSTEGLAGLIYLASATSETAAPEPGGSMTTVVIAVLGAMGFGAIVAAIISGLFSRRKLGAEATSLIQSAATGVVKDMQGQLERQDAEHAATMARIRADHARDKAAWEREMQVVRHVLQLHVAWDQIAIAKLAEVNIDLPPAPPLLPPPHERTTL